MAPPSAMARDSMQLRKIIAILSFLTPWQIRRLVLEKIMGYKIHPTSRIGISWIFPEHLIMEAHSKIGHFSVCKNIKTLFLKESSSIGKANWITGYPAGRRPHFKEQSTRKPQLILGEHSAITNWHLIDCTNSVTIGKYSTIAGFRSQILTHSIDLENCRQWSEPVMIGSFCFIGTNSVILECDYCKCSLVGSEYNSEPARLFIKEG